MKTIWKRIHAWLDEYAPAGYGHLRPGAGARAIEAAEKTMGLDLPRDVKASFAIHDGQEREPGLIGGEGWLLLSLREIVEQWRRWSQADPNNAHCVPIAWIGTGDYVFLNLDPDADEPGCLMIQRAVDAGVLAGARTLRNGEDEAREQALALAEANGASLVSGASLDVGFGSSTLL